MFIYFHFMYYLFIYLFFCHYLIMLLSDFKALLCCAAEQVLGTVLGRDKYTAASPQDHSGLG